MPLPGRGAAVALSALLAAGLGAQQVAQHPELRRPFVEAVQRLGAHDRAPAAAATTRAAAAAAAAAAEAAAVAAEGDAPAGWVNDYVAATIEEVEGEMAALQAEVGRAARGQGAGGSGPGAGAVGRGQRAGGRDSGRGQWAEDRGPGTGALLSAQKWAAAWV